MKALKHRDTGEWLVDIDKNGVPYTGNMPKKVGDRMKSVEQVENAENAFRGIDTQVDLSNYELVEIVIMEKADQEKLIELAYAYKQLTNQ